MQLHAVATMVCKCAFSATEVSQLAGSGQRWQTPGRHFELHWRQVKVQLASCKFAVADVRAVWIYSQRRHKGG